MKTLMLTTVIALGLAAPSWSATEVDTNGDGMLTLDEVQAVFPEITVETFTAMDANADGALDDEEVQAAQNAGVMPKSEG